MMAVSEEHKKLTDQHITKIAKKISVSKIKTLAVKEMQFKFEEIEVIKEAKKDKSEEVTQEILRTWRNRTSNKINDQIQVSFTSIF